MNITLIFFSGLFFALLGATPPGLLNMTAAKISLKEGHNRGIIFSIGVCIVFGLQTYIAALFARYLTKHPDVVDILRGVAFVSFALISAYCFFAANKQSDPQIDNVIKSKRSRFFQGMMLTALNFLTIPYHAYTTVTLASVGWLTFDKVNIASYVAGTVMGTFIMLYVYIFFFDKIKNEKLTSQKSMNYFIGTITAIIGIITLINIIKEF